MVITFSSMKGGVGKSSDAILLANCLAGKGKKILMVDLDPNNSATMYYTMGLDDIDALCEQNNIFEALTHRCAEKYILPTRKTGVEIIPSSLKLSDIRTIDYHILKRILSTLDHDYVVVDTAPTYDNHTMSALYAADVILTPVEFTSFNLTTSLYLRSKLYDELPEQTEKWYLLYSHWSEKVAAFATSTQMQYVKVFEENFDNILDIKIPHSTCIDKYTQTDEHVSMTSHVVGLRRLAESFNALASLITEDDSIVEVF